MSFTLKSVPLVAVGDNLLQERLFERGNGEHREQNDDEAVHMNNLLLLFYMKEYIPVPS